MYDYWDLIKKYKDLQQEHKKLKEKYENVLMANKKIIKEFENYQDIIIRISKQKYKAIEYIEQLPFNDLTPLEVKVIYKILGDKEKL